MTFSHAIYAFFSDLKLQAAVGMIVLDFGLGVAAAFKLGTFRLSYVADFARNDVGFKLLPWFLVYVGAKFAGHQQIVVPGFDLSYVADGFFALNMAAWVGSSASSLRELGFSAPGLTQATPKLAEAVAGNENAAPPKD